ncbi:MAG: hypothetical protein IJJ74_09615 [Eubacterium sp.]|nr:hypothetical protein [Eubacterium sp.]
MSFTDELNSNYNPPEELYYFKEIEFIVSRVFLEGIKNEQIKRLEKIY